MTETLKRCAGAQNRSGYVLGSGNAGSRPPFAPIAMWHGGLTDVMITCPGRIAANEALVTPRAAVGTAPLTGTSALPLTTGRSQALEPWARKSARSVSPTRTQ